MLVLLAAAGCGDSPRGNGGADTARPSPAASPPPAVAIASTKDTMTLSHPHAGAPPVLVVGPATIVLDSTKFAEVQTALGAASIVGDTTGSERLIEACYVAGAANDRVTVRLSALGNVDDDKATMQQALATIPINGAAIARGDVIGAGSSTPKRCAPLSVPPAEIRWANGLRLGMTRSEVERLLGASGESDRGEWVYKHNDPDFHEVGVDTATRQERTWRWDVTVSVQVRYDQDVATRIEASYAKSINAHPRIP